MAKPKQRYGIYNVPVDSITYTGAAQPCNGSMLPPRAAARCFATVTPSHTNVIRYLCGDGENVRLSGFNRTRLAPWQARRAKPPDNDALAYGCCEPRASAPAGRACRITNQSLSFKEQRSCGATLPPARDCAAPQSRSP
jgi:hypothetical protein